MIDRYNEILFQRIAATIFLNKRHCSCVVLGAPGGIARSDVRVPDISGLMKHVNILGGSGGSCGPNAIFSKLTGYCILEEGNSFGVGRHLAFGVRLPLLVLVNLLSNWL